ncbi:GNAT family N-acetyltransferase [Anaerobacillus alkaliphilus]|uniref:GNAT family N-acetyltransferase n=1 Tax=Anaerobacillus alkaliphilus TaxID=1548597 RepID=A0A4Q0VXA7_9BACI|nr:GNAT family N-acetyltransferase [Anaerobacillus alkaliphilus]RXJ04090.1 GNAT family N-acetyltransferase [Anaerobacillus alkaliphilus]
MESISFEQATDETLYIVMEMVNSNPEYNLLRHGKEAITLEEVKQEFINEHTKSLFIKLDDTYIGTINYLPMHPKDQCPWLNEFIIHRDYQGFGFGSQSYELFEKQLDIKKIRSGLVKNNLTGKHFLEIKGYELIYSFINQGLEIDVYERLFS